MKKLLWISAVLAAAACAKKAETDGDKEIASVAATVETAKSSRFVETVDAIGSVAPRAGHAASLAAPSPTRVSKIFVAAGNAVEAGDPLIEFEQGAFDAAAKSADAALAAAERAAERAQRLADAGVSPRKDAEAAAADLAAARSNAVVAHRARELSTLRSPIAGVVTRMSAVLGASVDAGQPLVEVADPGDLDVILTLSPDDAARVHAGSAVSLFESAAATDSAIAHGSVLAVGAVLDSTNRGVAARVAVTSSKRTLRIGESVLGRVTVQEHASVVTLPGDALVPSGEGFHVFVVDDKGIAHSRDVVIGGRTDAGVYIKSGVAAGEKVVTKGAYGMDDSVKVATGEAVTEPRKSRQLFDILSEQRRFVYLAIGLLSAAGIWSALKLPSAIYPELTFPRITIVAEGSSLGARQVVFAITRPLEEAVSIVPGVERVKSRSIRGGSEVSITFAEGSDMQYVLQLVRTRVEEIRGDLPAGLDIQIERLTPSLFPILSYNLEGGDPATLFDIARYQIKPVLSRVPGVGRVEVQGSDVREIEVIAEPARLAAAGLTYDDVATAIKQGIAVDAVGRVAQDYKQYLVVSAQEAHSADDVANVVVKGALRVRDIATVVPGTEDHVRIIAGDGRPAALLNVTRQIGGNTVAIADSVAGAVRELSKTLPAGVRLTPVYDQAALVRDAVSSVRDAMLIGALLAVIILLLFLRHLRITAISATAIPLTLAITVFVMRMLGQTFNLMTLGAMAIAIGLVIDDAVVITENIVRHLKLTDDRTLAIREAVQELLVPVTTSTLTTVVVFLPLGMLEGVAGQFFSALSLTLTVSVLVSLVLAVTIIPLFSEQFLTADDSDHNVKESTGILARIGAALDRLSDRYARALTSVLHHGRLMAVAALLLVIAGVAAYKFVGSGFLPEMDEGAFILDYWSPGGTALAETDRQLHVVEQILKETPEITGTSRRTGAELGLFATEQNRGDIAVRLLPMGKRHRSIDKVIDEVRDKVALSVPRLRVEFVEILDVLDDLSGSSRPVEIKLFGADLHALETYAGVLAPKVGKVDGLDDFFGGIAPFSAEMSMKIHGDEAGRLGLSAQQVSTAVSGALLGVPAGEIRLDDRSIGVRVRAPDSVRLNARRLGALPVLAPGSRQAAPLASLADFTPADVRSEYVRENQQQMIALTSGVGDRALSKVMADVKAVLDANPAPAGIRVELGGRYASQQTAFRALLLVLALAAVSVMAVMVVQFRSFVEPLVVLLAAPLSFVGALVLLLVTGTALNVSSFMGLILLVGLIVKNGIILLDFTKIRMQSEGVDLETGITEAARVRLRPILMTTLCTLFGLLPLALGLGAGSELQKPLALAVIGGLALSTPVTLFVVPVLLVAIRGRTYRLPAA